MHGRVIIKIILNSLPIKKEAHAIMHGPRLIIIKF
jgi:hypothetical protein